MRVGLDNIKIQSTNIKMNTINIAAVTLKLDF